MFARAIHAASRRREGRFIGINCAALPKDLLESELFGHKKGAFSGAIQDRQGAFEQADGGTLFLDEISECSTETQAKLLRILQPPHGETASTRPFNRVGETEERRSDVRIIAATNRDLSEDIKKGRFRDDLYYRLASITIKLPPLRERKTDIPDLIDALLGQINAEFEPQEPGYSHKTLSAAAISFVKRQSWPGNVRQLYNVLVQAAVFSESDVIGPADLEASLMHSPAETHQDILSLPLGDGFSLEGLLKDVQRQYLLRGMDEAGGVKAKAAKLLGYSNYQTLDAQLNRLNVRWTASTDVK
jgi:transcriptional regulator with PAS, ATPase and Fis domain